MRPFVGRNQGVFGVLLVAALAVLLSGAAAAGEYGNALKDVSQVRAVFDVSQGSPQMSNVVFWAVKNVYEDESVRGLAQPPRVVIVFHGPAVKLLTSDWKDFGAEEAEEVGKFQETLRQMKKDGVILEVCDYALKVTGVDPATVMPEIDHVGNGFVSVVGYQAQGYAVVRLP